MSASFSSFLRLVRHQQRVLETHQRRIARALDAGDETAPSPSGRLWGERECATTALMKLAQVQIKWAELEWEALRHQGAADTAGDAPLTPEEIEIYQESLRRRTAPAHSQVALS
jgi:hypothetical protein